MKRNERIAVFVKEIWKWYGENKRTLPWRDLSVTNDTERAYQILISEVMLQQTQVERVKIVFRLFLERYPKISDLSSTSNREVILAWRGMGYNSRALRLRDAAQIITSDFESVFPSEMKALESIKGIGHYTAAAIRNFSFNIPTPCVDTNIRRLLHRTFIGPENADGTWKKDDRYLTNIADECLSYALDGLPDHDTRNWHAALMDFGSLVCTKRNPKWERCPLTQKGIMKAANKVPTLSDQQSAIRKKSEPGRMVGSKYIPNRIFRGRIVDELRDEPSGLQLNEIGRRICIDWSPSAHKKWLTGLVEKLREDQLITQLGEKYQLGD